LERGEANPTLGTAGKILALLGLRLEFSTVALTSQSPKSREDSSIETNSINNEPKNKGQPVLVRETRISYRGRT
jgi:hypothetical protein